LIVYSPVVANSSLRREMMTARGFAENCCEQRGGGIVAVTFAKLRCWRIAARRRRLLHQLDERMLRDIGVTRADVLFRTFVEDAAAPEREVNMSRPAALAPRPTVSRAALALMIITLSLVVTVVAA
jgi:Domain of unknown function (DUF1127)